MSRYKVLWIDDNAEEQDAFSESAYQHGLDINSYKTSKQGMEELVSNIEQYDAVILDAMVYNESEDENASLKGLFSSIKKINSLSERRKMPYFIFSAYIDNDTYASAREMLSGERIFIKSKDNLELFNAVKNDADKQEITQLKHKYPIPFSLCEDNYLGAKEFQRVLQIVKDIEDPEKIYNQQDSLSPLRKILESIFKKLNAIGLIPDEIQNNQGAINGASIFLSGSHKSYNYYEELIHPVISESIRHLISLTQDASHNEGKKLRADSYLSNSSNTFLYQSLCFSMLEVLEYFKPFFDEYSDKSINETKWGLIANPLIIPGNWISGKVKRVAENGFGTFLPDNSNEEITIHWKMVSSHELKDGDNILVTTEPSPDGKKTHIKEIRTNI